MRSISLFFLMFHSLYFLMNLYVFWRLFGYFGIHRPVVVWPVVGVCTFSLFLATIAYYRFGPVVYPAYYCATLWFGVVWLLFWCLVICEPLRLILRGVRPAWFGYAVITVVGIATIYGAVHARHFRVVYHKIPSPVRLRLVHMSDLHLGSVRAGYAARIVDAINSLQPDAILVTGDTIDSTYPVSSDALQVLRGLKAPVFCVTGNHERYAGLDRSIPLLESVGFRVLRAQMVDFRGIRIIGFDDDSQTAALASRLARMDIDPSAFNILLLHRPDGFRAVAATGINLMLVGHTHRGQIFPFSLYIWLHYKYPFGLYHFDNSTLYTTQGTGTWGPRMRLGTTSEIAVFDLVPAEQMK